MGETENQIKPNQNAGNKPWRLTLEIAMVFVIGFLLSSSLNSGSFFGKLLFGENIQTSVVNQGDGTTKIIGQDVRDLDKELDWESNLDEKAIKDPITGNYQVSGDVVNNYYKDSEVTYNTYNTTGSDLSDLDCEGCVDNKDLALDSVLGQNIGFHAVDTGELDSRSVTSRVLADNSVDSEHLDHRLTIKKLNIEDYIKVQKHIDLSGYEKVKGYLKVAQDTNPENFTLASNSPDAYVEGKFEAKDAAYFQTSVTVKDGNDSTTITPTSIVTSSFNADDITLTTANITTANVTTLDLGTNTITDQNLSGNWDFNGGNLTNIGAIASGAVTATGNILPGTDSTYDLGSSGNEWANLFVDFITTSGATFSDNLDMQNNLILNIGNANTDFTATGGLNLAGDLAVSTNITANDIESTTGTITTLDGTTLSYATANITTGNVTTLQNVTTATIATGNVTTANIGTANVTTLDLGTNTVSDQSMTGNWDLGGGNLSNINNLAVSTLTDGFIPYHTNDTTGLADSIIYTDGTNVGIGTTDPNYDLEVNGTGYFSSDLSIGGDLTVSGDSLVIGSSSSDTLTVNSSVNSSLVPDVNAVRDLGSASYYWDDLYIDAIYANSIFASATSISGTQAESFTINSDNATADTEDQNIIFFRGTVVPNALIGWDSTNDRFDFNQPVFIQNDTTSTGIITLNIKGTSGQNADLLRISNFDGSQVVSVTNGGNVGIGTTTPGSYKLYVNGNTYIAGNLELSGTVDGKDIATNAAMLNEAETISANWVNTANPWADNEIASSSNWNTAYIHSQATSNVHGLTFTSEGSGGGLDADLLDGQHGAYYLPAASISGTDNYIPRFNGTSALENSIIYDDGTNVGIGTTSPNATLDVAGGIYSKGLRIDNTTDTRITMVDTSTPTVEWRLQNQNDYFHITRNAGSGDETFFGIQNDGDVQILNGNLGVGTANPGYPLHVAGNAKFESPDATHFTAITSPGGFPGLVGYATNRRDLRFDTTGISLLVSADGNAPSITNGIIINESGNVGIGTTNPQQLLTLSATDNPVLRFDRSNSGAYDWEVYSLSGADLRFRGGADGTGASLVDRLTIQQSGSIGIGTTSPGQKLDVFGGSIRTTNQLISTIATGTAPLAVSSTTVVSNLNADYLDGQHGSYYMPASTDNWVDTTGDTMTGALTVQVSNGTVWPPVSWSAPHSELLLHNSSDVINSFTGIEFRGGSTNYSNGFIGILSDGLGVYSTDMVFATRLDSGAMQEIARFNQSGDFVTTYDIEAGSTSRAGNTTIKALSADTNISGFEAYGNSQGTGYLYVGQSTTYGGGIIYNGDGSPSSVGTTDHVSIFRRTSGTDVEVLHWLHSNSTAYFEGNVDFQNNAIVDINWAASDDGSGSGLDADLLDGYHLSTTRNAANTVPVRDASGYLQLGWINTTSGSAGTTAPDRIYGSYDAYIRYYTPANFANVMEPYFDDYFWQADNDGSGSGLDADLLDGISSGSFLRSDVDDTFTGGTLTLTNNADAPMLQLSRSDGGYQGISIDMDNDASNNEYAFKIRSNDGGTWTDTNTNFIVRADETSTYVGIGTASPAATLDVDAANSLSGVHIENGNGSDTWLNYQNGSTNYIRGTTTYVDTTLDMNNNAIVDIDWANSDHGLGSGLYADYSYWWKPMANYSIANGTLPQSIVNKSARLDFISDFSGGGSGYRTVMTLAGANTYGVGQIAFPYNSGATSPLYWRSANYSTNSFGSWAQIWDSVNDGSGSGLDADLLDGYNLAEASTASTVVFRNSSGDINARLFRSEYDTTNASINYIMTQVDTASNNYIRPSTPAQLVAGLGLEAGGSRDIWVEKAGDTMTGDLNLGFNYASWYDTNAYHAIGSKDNTGANADDLRINSYGAVYVNLDSNANNSSGADFRIGRHGYAGTISDWIFSVDGENGNVGIGTTSPAADLEVGDGAANVPAWVNIIGSGSTVSGVGAMTGSRMIYLYNDGGVNIKLDAYDYSISSATDIQLGGNGGAINIAGTVNMLNHAITNINWASSDDGAGSGLDADLLDGISSGSFLRSDADDTLAAAIVVSGSHRDDGIIGTYDSYKTQQIWSMGTAYRNAADGSTFGNLYGLAYYHTNNASAGTMASGHQAVWVQNGSPKVALGTNIWTSGSVISSGNMYVGGTTNYLSSQPSGDYGSIQVNGGGKGGWEGYSIDGRFVFMHDGSTAGGIFNDVENEWMFYGVRNSYTRMYYNGSSKLETTSGGISVSGGGTFSSAIAANGGLSQDGNTVLNGTDTWLRTTGNTGWYSATYGGGWYMTDSSYIRPYNSKSLHMVNANIDYVNQLHFNDNVRFYDSGGNSYLEYKYGNTGAGGIRIYDGDTSLQGYLYANGSAAIGFLSADGSWALRMDNDDAQIYHALTATGGLYITASTGRPELSSNTSGLLIDATNNGGWDMLVYESTSYLPQLRMGYNGTALITTYDSGENLELTSNGGNVTVSDDLSVSNKLYLPGISTGSSGSWLYVGAGNEVFKLASSIRYKKNITDLTFDKDKFFSLNPRAFDWKSTGEADIGFIAEEVEQVLPDFVIYNEEGLPESLKYQWFPIYLYSITKEHEQSISEISSRLNDFNLSGLTAEEKVGAIEETLEQLGNQTESLDNRIAEVEDQLDEFTITVGGLNSFKETTEAALSDHQQQIGTLQFGQLVNRDSGIGIGNNYNYLRSALFDLSNQVASINSMPTQTEEIERSFYDFSQDTQEHHTNLENPNFTDESFGGTYENPGEFSEISIDLFSGIDLSDLDTENGYLELEVYMQEASLIEDFHTELGNERDSGELQWDKPQHPFFENGWNKVRLPISEGTKTGQIDWENLDYFRIYFKFKSPTAIRIRDVSFLGKQTVIAQDERILNIGGIAYNLSEELSQSDAIVALAGELTFQKERTGFAETQLTQLTTTIDNINSFMETANLMLSDHEQRIAQLEALIMPNDQLQISSQILSPNAEKFFELLSYEELDGKVKFTVDGDLKAENLETAKMESDSVTTASLTVKDRGETAPEGKETGSAIIRTGQQEIFIENTNIKNTSRIIVTPVGNEPINWILSKKRDNEGFVIRLDKPAEFDVAFDYWIVQTE